MKLNSVGTFATILGFLQQMCVLVFADHGGTSENSKGNHYQRKETLDPKGKYQLEWVANSIQKRVTFNVTVETRGYVGFGLSDQGKMSGADIVIGGMFSNGQSYFSDRHAVGTQVPEVDVSSQDWKLHEGRENRTHTFLSFSRDFDTCDPQDYPITEDKLSIIWCYGEGDEIVYHHQNRGVFNVHLLDPHYSSELEVVDPISSTELSSYFQVWTIDYKLQVYDHEDTIYWCTIHQAPRLSRKHHVVGMNVRLENEQSRKNIRHLFVYKCNVPQEGNQSGNEIFYDFVSYNSGQGQMCLNLRQPTGPMPTEYCTELFMIWTVGGREFFNPSHVGFPFGEDSPDEYYLVQMHYDNSNGRGQVVEADVKLDIYYTSDLRPNEGGILNVRHTTPGRPPSFLVPPSSINHKIHGICGTHCTREILPERGIHVYALHFHTHKSGRRMKLHHFRQTKELPWIARDDNFDSEYQQTRLLSEERTVLPWDVLAISCEYDNTWTNGTVLGGYSARQEVCAAFLFYCNKIRSYQECSSEIGSPEFRRRLLGIRNITWFPAEMEYIVADNVSLHHDHYKLIGLRVSEVSDNHVDWTIEKRRELQKFQLTSQHVNWCFAEVYAGGPINTPETELIPPRPKRQKQPSRSIGKRRKRQVAPSRATTSIPRYEPEWQDPRRFSHFPTNIKPYVPPKRKCSAKIRLTD